jgi:hypothetical protein
MRKRRYTEYQIIGFLKQANSGIPVPELVKKHGFIDASFYKWIDLPPTLATQGSFSGFNA